MLCLWPPPSAKHHPHTPPDPRSSTTDCLTSAQCPLHLASPATCLGHTCRYCEGVRYLKVIATWPTYFFGNDANKSKTGDVLQSASSLMCSKPNSVIIFPQSL